MPLVLNMPALKIWQACQYAGVTQGAEYALIIFQYAQVCLNNAESA